MPFFLIYSRQRKILVLLDVNCQRTIIKYSLILLNIETGNMLCRRRFIVVRGWVRSSRYWFFSILLNTSEEGVKFKTLPTSTGTQAKYLQESSCKYYYDSIRKSVLGQRPVALKHCNRCNTYTQVMNPILGFVC
jgi:hypothetical protein